MPDRREPIWPISRHVVRMSLSRSGIPPRNRPTDIICLAGSDQFQWCRFEAPFSRLVIEHLAMEIDPATGRYMDDDKRLARQIFRSFTEPITDMTVARRGKWHYIATFTLYTGTPVGLDSYQRRMASKLTWEQWAEENSF